MENKDISKRTVLVLLILTLVISVVGTWTILSQPSSIELTTYDNGYDDAKVKVSVLDGPPTPIEPTTVNEGGQVAVKILK